MIIVYKYSNILQLRVSTDYCILSFFSLKLILISFTKTIENPGLFMGSFKKYVTQKNSNLTPSPPIVTDCHIFSDTPHIST